MTLLRSRARTLGATIGNDILARAEGPPHTCRVSAVYPCPCRVNRPLAPSGRSRIARHIFARGITAVEFALADREFRRLATLHSHFDDTQWPKTNKVSAKVPKAPGIVWRPWDWRYDGQGKLKQSGVRADVSIRRHVEGSGCAYRPCDCRSTRLPWFDLERRGDYLDIPPFEIEGHDDGLWKTEHSDSPPVWFRHADTCACKARPCTCPVVEVIPIRLHYGKNRWWQPGPGRKKLVTQEILVEIRALHDQGLGIRAIAKRLGVSKSSVAAWLADKGVQKTMMFERGDVRPSAAAPAAFFGR